MDNEKQIQAWLKQAAKAENHLSLFAIANMLDSLGAWDKAEEVRHEARRRKAQEENVA